MILFPPWKIRNNGFAWWHIFLAESFAVRANVLTRCATIPPRLLRDPQVFNMASALTISQCKPVSFVSWQGSLNLINNFVFLMTFGSMVKSFEIRNKFTAFSGFLLFRRWEIRKHWFEPKWIEKNISFFKVYPIHSFDLQLVLQECDLFWKHKTAFTNHVVDGIVHRILSAEIRS